MNGVMSRERWLTWALAAPAIAAALAIVGVEIWRTSAPFRAQSGYHQLDSLGQASVLDDVRGAYAFIRRGQDPNALIAVYDDRLTGGEWALVPPIAWAAAGGRPRIVRMLLAAGVTFDRDIDRAAACLADQAGHADIAALLRQLAPLPPANECPPPADGPPLLSLTGSR
jgi:hypothetical protein